MKTIDASVVREYAGRVEAYLKDPAGQGGDWTTLKDEMTRAAKRQKVSFAALFTECHRLAAETSTSR